MRAFALPWLLHVGEEMADTALVEYHYRCSDEEYDRLMRRQDGRDGAAGERPGQRLNRALIALCDEVENSDGGFTIALMNGPLSQEERLHKARIERTTRDRVNGLVKRLPGVSRDRFTREAIRRWTKAY